MAISGCSKISILPNGFFKKTRNAISVKNTTVPDAIFHIILCYLADSNLIDAILNDAAIDSSYKEFIGSYFHRGTVQTTLAARTKILEKLFQVTTYNNMVELDCISTIPTLLPKIAAKLFLLSAIKIYPECQACSQPMEENVTFINIEIDFSKSSSNVFQLQTQERCNKCDKIIHPVFHLKDTIFVDNSSSTDKIEWTKIPKVVIIDQHVYILFGIIQRICNNAYDHHVCHVMRSNLKWYTFNNQNTDVENIRIGKHHINIELLAFKTQSAIKEKFAFAVEDIRIVPNANIRKEDSKVVAKNTCAFDSIAQVFATFFYDHSMLVDAIADSRMLFDEFLIEFLDNKKSFADINRSRNKMVARMFPDRVENRGDKVFIDAYSCLNEVIQKLIPMSDIVFSMKKVYVCHTCDIIKEKFTTYLPMRYRNLWRENIENLQVHIDIDEVAIECCKTCLIQEDSSIVLNDIIMVPVENMYPDEKQHPTNLEKISPELRILDQTYTIYAVVEYRPGHFIAHINRKSGEWQSYDNLHTSLQPTPKELHAILLFYRRSGEIIAHE